MHSFSQQADNGTDVRWSYNPETMETRAMFDGPAMWSGEVDDQPAPILATFTPDQMRSLVLWWTSNDPGDRWTSSSPST